MSIRQKIDKKFKAKLLSDIRLYLRKGHDYGRDEDPLSNVRSAEEWGVQPWVGVMIRLTDKIRRLQTLAKKGQLKNESAQDSLRDIRVYSVLAEILLEENQ
jgi:hypothetical protein